MATSPLLQYLTDRLTGCPVFGTFFPADWLVGGAVLGRVINNQARLIVTADNWFIIYPVSPYHLPNRIAIDPVIQEELSQLFDCADVFDWPPDDGSKIVDLNWTDQTSLGLLQELRDQQRILDIAGQTPARCIHYQYELYTDQVGEIVDLSPPFGLKGTVSITLRFCGIGGEIERWQFEIDDERALSAAAAVCAALPEAGLKPTRELGLCWLSVPAFVASFSDVPGDSQLCLPFEKRWI